MERKINYYETDKMGVVHHSNYIRFLEEARCDLLEEVGMPYEVLEQNGIIIPVLEVKCEYKKHVTFGDTIIITPHVREYNGVRLSVSYDVIDKKTGMVVINAETKHCFTNMELRPINMKKKFPDFSKKWEELLENIEGRTHLDF